MIGLARNLRRSGRVDEALAVYREAATVEDASVAGVPISLLARSARCELLAASGRGDDARTEARQLLDDLQHGRWAITRAAYDANVATVRDLLPAPPASAPAGPAEISEALAAAASDLLESWQHKTAREGTPTVAHALNSTTGVPVVVVRREQAGELVALIAGPGYVASQWLARAEPALRLQRVRVTLRDPATPASGPQETRRVAGETALPWTVAAESEDEQAEMASLNRRRALWLAGLCALALMLVAATAVTARAMSREMAAARLQSDFVAAVSHEFRTPLTTLRQLTEILGDNRLASESRRHTYYAALARQTDRLQRLVESLLDFGRMEAGSSPYRFEPVEVMAFVRTVSAEFAAESMARGSDIDIQISGSEASVNADRDALANSLWNLLENAVKYSPGCRTIWVVVDSDPDRVAIRVRDQGFGIPREEQGRIFEKFVRGARATTDRIKGTGIGLSIVQHVVAAHGGEVEVESEPGAGSTFTMWFPRMDMPSDLKTAPIHHEGHEDHEVTHARS